MPTWIAIKHFLKYLPVAAGMLFTALFFIMKGQRDAAAQKASAAKDKLTVSEKARTEEHEIQEKQTEAQSESFAERERQDTYKQSGERPDTFGDDRLK